jgi:hypothetical protein
MRHKEGKGEINERRREEREKRRAETTTAPFCFYI